MGKKCLVPGCNPNHFSKEIPLEERKKSPIFRLPKDVNQLALWEKAIPFKISSKEAVLCERHWPAAYVTIKKKGKERPRDPPSIWPGISLSSLPTPPRPTKRTSLVVRGTQPDQMSLFKQKDDVSFNKIRNRVILKNHKFRCPTVAYEADSKVYIHSVTFYEGVPRFLLQVDQMLHFKSFHMGIKVNVPCLVTNRTTILNSWSAVEEIVNFLHNYEEPHKTSVIHQQMQAMRGNDGNKSLYIAEILVRAFSYFVISRSLYQKMRKDLQLPSISTLTRITSTCAKKCSSSLLNTVFSSVENSQKVCVMLVDEVYVKKSLQFHGGEVFGKAANNSSLIADTMLGQMDNSWGSRFSINNDSSL